MILSEYRFDGDTDDLLARHRKMLDFYPPGSLELHVVIAREGGISVYDACPDRATHDAFVASPEFRGALEHVGLPTPSSIDVLGEVHCSLMNQSVIA